MRRASNLILAIVLGLGAVACAGEEVAPADGTPTVSLPSEEPSPSPSPTEEPSPSPTEEPSPSRTPSPELEDGRHFGFVRSIDPDGMTLVFDLAYFLTGEEANEAAVERGDEVPVPNDYYIVNDNPRLRTLVLAPDVELALIDWNRCCDRTFDGDLEVFAMALETGEPVTVGDDIYYGALSPYWLEVEEGLVVRIEDQYLP